MKPPFTIRIDLPPTPSSYDILIGQGIIDAAGAAVNGRLGPRRCIVLTDDNVAPLYFNRLHKSLSLAGHEVLPAIILPAGEQTKSMAFLQTVLSELFAREADRKTLLIALGGGVIGDLTGFAASILLRGIDFIQVPTTLLSQVDSSVGGKTGINSSYGKNTIGTFYQPRLVISDVTTLATLPQRQLASGYAEVVKYGLIQAPLFFDWCCLNAPTLLDGKPEASIEAVSQSCQYKAEIVAKDEKEAGLRALLNLGHTFGHALESAMGYGDALLHGEAVAIGTVMAFDLSVLLGLCPAPDALRVRQHFSLLNLSTTPKPMGCSIDDLLALMYQDKKAVHGKLNLVLVKGIGKAFIAKDVPETAIRSIWEKTLA
jgi:3-dehydroquinate synthase